MSLFDLENELPDDLIPNGDLALMGISSNGGPGGGGPGRGPSLNMVPDAAAKHKQLSELLRPGSTSILAVGHNQAGPQQGGMGGGQLGQVLGKGPMGQGSPSHPSAQVQKGGQGNGNPGMNFNQAMMNSGQSHGVLGQPSPGPVMNGGMGPAGRGRPGPGMQYQGQGMQGAPVGVGAGVGGSVLAEALTQGGPQMGAHHAMNSQQAGNMNKVSRTSSVFFMEAVVCEHWQGYGLCSTEQIMDVIVCSYCGHPFLNAHTSTHEIQLLLNFIVIYLHTHHH